MRKKTVVDISIVVVHYKVKNELLQCIASIIASKPRVSYEIIVVNNDNDISVNAALQKKYRQVRYIQNDNKGFGQAVNVGVQHARGEYLFILNPDTILFKGTLDTLYSFLQTKSDMTMVAPLLIDAHDIPHFQGTMELSPRVGVVVLSVINKIFPHNKISDRYFIKNWDRKSIRAIDTISGIFMIRKDIFINLGGFDKNFFLYFEEFDLCKRFRNMGGNAYLLPTAKVFHRGGTGTKHVDNLNRIFAKSRRYYFRKHYGYLWSLLIEGVLCINKYSFIVFISILLGIFLAFYKIENLMLYGGDIGWFYMQARDMLQTGTIPLVSIPSSHPWLHQGPYWTYMLAGALFFSFNPLQGVYVTIASFLVTILLLYIIGKKLFSARVGVIASILYAASPLVVMNARMPYHTSVIPFFSVLLLYTVVRWIEGNKYFFPLSIMLLAVLYNFEIATAIFGGVFLLITLFGIWEKKKWAKNILTKKIIGLSIIAYVLPMLPMLLYDSTHNFPQTIRFLMWVGYRILVVFGYPELHPEILPHTSLPMSDFVIHTVHKLFFAPSSVIAVSILVLSIVFLGVLLWGQWKHKKLRIPHTILFLLTTIPFLAIMVMGTVSDAYFPMLFPFFILCAAVYLSYLFTRKYGKVYIPLFLAIYVAGNTYALLKHDYFQQKGLYYSDKVSVSKQLVTEAQGKEYNLVGIGKWSQFESYTMPYQYLTWLLGNEPVKKKVQKTFIIEEQPNGIILLQRND